MCATSRSIIISVPATMNASAAGTSQSLSLTVRFCGFFFFFFFFFAIVECSKVKG